MKSSLLGMVKVVCVTLTLSGCSTAAPPVVSEWRNPAYASGGFKRVMVGGPSGNATVRRSFEDEFVVQLRAAGVDALPSYRYLPEEQAIDEDKLKQAAEKAGVDAVLFPRSLHTEQKTKIGPSFPFSFGVFGSNVGASWSGPAGSASVTRYKEYTSETVLYDIGKNDLVWSATIKTTEPENLQTAIKSYVEAVMKGLEGQNLLPKR
jgi:hypothetical protein